MRLKEQERAFERKAREYLGLPLEPTYFLTGYMSPDTFCDYKDVYVELMLRDIRDRADVEKMQIYRVQFRVDEVLESSEKLIGLIRIEIKADAKPYEDY